MLTARHYYRRVFTDRNFKVVVILTYSSRNYSSIGAWKDSGTYSIFLPI